jgi:nucleotidyltransferase/DNA polymerase involved in DNA repair
VSPPFCANIAHEDHINRYREFSLRFYTVLMHHADDLQAVSVDEALLDVTSTIERLRSRHGSTGGITMTSDPAKEFAEKVRAEVKKATSCDSKYLLSTVLFAYSWVVQLASVLDPTFF